MIVLGWQPALPTVEDSTRGHKSDLCTFGANPNAYGLVMCVVRILAVLYYSKRHGLLAFFRNE